MKNIQVVFLFLIFIVVISCSDKTNPVSNENSSDIVVAPEKLMLVDKEKGYLWVSSKSSSKFSWIITKYPTWIKVENESGLSDGQPVKLYFAGNLELSKPQNLEGVIEITIAGGTIFKVPVVLAIDGRPRMSLSTSQIYFSTTNNRQEFQIKNLGSGILDWKIKKNYPNLTFTPDSGKVMPNYPTTVIASLDVKNYKPGFYNDTIEIYSQKDTAKIYTYIDIPTIHNYKTPYEVNIPIGTIDTSFYINNLGNVNVNWEIKDTTNYITVYPISGTLVVGDSVKINMKIDRSKLSNSVLNTKMKVVTKYETKEIYTSVAHFVDEKTLLKYEITDAKYFQDEDLIVFATKNPSSLVLMDFNGIEKNKIDLQFPPLCLSNVNLGNVAVGHSGKVSIVNLVNKNVTKVIPLSCDPVSMALSPSNWVYVSPLKDQWEPIRCIDIENSQEILSNEYDIRDHERFIMHPSGKYLYTMDIGSSPQDMTKFDISNGKAIILYDGPYHGDYAMGWGFWMSEKGDKIFTSSGNTFKVDESQSEDMKYKGSIGLKNLQSLHQHSSGKIAVAYHTEDNYGNINKSFLNILNDDNYSVNKSIKIPNSLYYNANLPIKYYIKESFCQNIFINNNGDKVFLLINSAFGGYNMPTGEWSFYIANIK